MGPMYQFTVGKPYNPKVKSWPETPQYNYRGGAHELILFYNQPTKREIRDVSTGVARFALFLQGDLIVFCFRFGDQPWSDAPYSWHLVPEHERTIPPELMPEEMPLLTVMLVDALTGIVQAIRALSMGHEFSSVLHAAIRRQAEQPFNPATYDRTLGDLLAKNTSDMLARKGIVSYRSEAMRRGRPPKYGNSMVLYSAHLRQDQIDWLSERGGSETLRDLIDREMGEEK